jgi:hypothetical protein
MLKNIQIFYYYLFLIVNNKTWMLKNIQFFYYYLFLIVNNPLKTIGAVLGQHKIVT